MTPVNEASALDVTVNFPGSRYTLKLPTLSVLKVVVPPLASFAVNVPFTIGFWSAPSTLPDTISAAAGDAKHIATTAARITVIIVIRISGILRRQACDPHNLVCGWFPIQNDGDRIGGLFHHGIYQKPLAVPGYDIVPGKILQRSGMCEKQRIVRLGFNLG